MHEELVRLENLVPRGERGADSVKVLTDLVTTETRSHGHVASDDPPGPRQLDDLDLVARQVSVQVAVQLVRVHHQQDVHTQVLGGVSNQVVVVSVAVWPRVDDDTTCRPHRIHPTVAPRLYLIVERQGELLEQLYIGPCRLVPKVVHQRWCVDPPAPVCSKDVFDQLAPDGPGDADGSLCHIEVHKERTLSQPHGPVEQHPTQRGLARVARSHHQHPGTRHPSLNRLVP
mmetsp:Transcript_20085/g.43489  ORF Transcript_20085/g.43489 Transcript_20085/m.43489 type:complete len:229 (+) Transcript_20085:338-1024(+)